jgi:hypothetical protein
LVGLFELYDDARTCKLQIIKHSFKESSNLDMQHNLMQGSHYLHAPFAAIPLASGMTLASH